MFVLAILVASLCWQALTVAGQGIAFAGAEDAAHALLHWNDSAHHHDDDGAVSHDDTSSALSHVAGDGAFQSPAITAALQAQAVSAPSLPPAEVEARGASPPHPDGLRRPPRSLA